MKTHHAGRVNVPEKELLKWLGFSGGTVHYIGKPEDMLDVISVLIEHKDMPEIPEGGVTPIVFPVYYYPDRMVRIFPRRYPKSRKLNSLVRRLLRKPNDVET